MLRFCLLFNAGHTKTPLFGFMVAINYISLYLCYSSRSQPLTAHSWNQQEGDKRPYPLWHLSNASEILASRPIQDTILSPSQPTACMVPVSQYLQVTTIGLFLYYDRHSNIQILLTESEDSLRCNSHNPSNVPNRTDTDMTLRSTAGFVHSKQFPCVLWT